MSEVKERTGYELWWWNEGSGMSPNGDEEGCFWVERVARIAWSNGEYCQRNHRDEEKEHLLVALQGANARAVAFDRRMKIAEAALWIMADRYIKECGYDHDDITETDIVRMCRHHARNQPKPTGKQTEQPQEVQESDPSQEVQSTSSS